MPEPKHRDVLRVLKSRILRGVYSERLPGDRVLAAELGVSPPTVKTALVQLEALGLVRRELRRGTFVVPTRERRRWGVSMGALLALRTSGADGTSQWVMETVFGFEEAAKRHGVDMILVRGTAAQTGQILDEVLAHLRSMTCLGACMLSFPVDTRMALRLKQAEGPVILADWYTDDPVLHTVVFDDEQAGRLIAEHLVQLGHRYVLWMDMAGPSPSRTARRGAAERVFTQAGARLRFVGRPEFRSHAACRDFLLADDRPTAIITGGLAPCIEVATIAGHLGLQVPGQLSLASVGEGLGNVGTWQFTGIDLHPADMGRKAFELLLHVNPADDVRTHTVPVLLLDRGTTAPPAPL